MATLFVVRLGLLCIFVCGVFVKADSNEVPDDEYLEPYLNRHYKLSSSDKNFEKILKELGVGSAKREAAKRTKPTITLTKGEDGQYTLETKTKAGMFSSTFKIGEEQELVTLDGRHVKSTVTQERNKLTEVQRGHRTVTVTHEFSMDQVVESIELDGTTTVRLYKYIQQ